MSAPWLRVTSHKNRTLKCTAPKYSHIRCNFSNLTINVYYHLTTLSLVRGVIQNFKFHITGFDLKIRRKASKLSKILNLRKQRNHPSPARALPFKCSVSCAMRLKALTVTYCNSYAGNRPIPWCAGPARQKADGRSVDKPPVTLEVKLARRCWWTAHSSGIRCDVGW